MEGMLLLPYSIREDMMHNEVKHRRNRQRHCLRRQRRDMQHMQQRERNPKCHQGPTHARHVVAHTTRLPCAAPITQLAERKTVVKYKVYKNGHFGSYNESDCIG